MLHRTLFRTTTCVMALGLLPALASAADYSGNYEDARRSVIVAPDGTGYRGEIRIGDQAYPLAAREEGDHLTGAYIVGGKPYTFSATQEGDGLLVTTNGKTYQLHRKAAAPAAVPNPFDPAGSAGPGSAPAGGPASGVTAKPGSPPAADALADYTVLNLTDVGRTLVREMPSATSTHAALRAVFADLARQFGARPTILGSYEEAREHSMAYVAFSAEFEGKPIKGFVTARLREEGAVAFVVFGNADATRNQLDQLLDHPPVPIVLSEPERIKMEMAKVELKVYPFPDRTGSVGIAEGYTINSPSEANSLILGPAGQKVRMAFGQVFYTPDSQMVRQNQQNQANAKKFGGRPQPGLNLPIAAYSDDPATALANFVRINSEASQRSGGPAFVPQKVINVTPVPNNKPGVRTAQVTYDVVIKERTGDKPLRALIQFDILPLDRGAWNMYVYLQLIAPRETFKKDLPVMMAQAYSLNENAERIKEKSRVEIAAANKRAEDLRAANKKIADAHYAQTKSAGDASARQSKAWRDAEENDTLKHRSAADFSEAIRGIRSIEDTKTGEKQSVNLADSNLIVDALNEKDPGRYRPVPLRDEIYPLAGHENERDYLGR